MVRLALVDPSDRGQQPLWSPGGDVAILFNGEMYNFREERKRLEARGHRFRSTTDTEVVLHLYLERGKEFVEHLRGMFALAIFDWRLTGKDQPPQLLLARGPMGIKPLYVAHPEGEPNAVLFASELRSLLASKLIPRHVDRRAMAEYLASGFVWQPHTMIQGVRMVEAGTWELYEQGRTPRVERFWRLPPYEPEQESLDQAADRLRSVLDESIHLHALADAPVGAFLSGGVDSTAIVALMRKHVPHLRTYTLRFPEFKDSDESVDAAHSAELLDVQNTIVDVTGSEVANILPKFCGDLDQPSNDGINTWIVSRAAAADVKGVLSGLGGDEWFAGYPVTRRMSRYSNHPLGWIQSLTALLAHGTYELVPRGLLRRRLANLAARRNALSTWNHAHSVFDWSEVRRCVGLSASDAPLIAQLEHSLEEYSPGWQRESAVGLSLLLDARIYMGNQLLRDSDATSMAHSLELRVPFVDLQVSQFSRSCFDHHKLITDGGYGDDYVRTGSKRVLIHAVRDVLPLAIAHRPKKGFTVPIFSWMNTALRHHVESACSPEAVRSRGLIDPALVSPHWQAFAAGSSGSNRELWALTILELWCRNVLDQKLEDSADDSQALPIAGSARPH
jgi:asparagine synthase (glutamine-hydrolysing)